MSLDAEAMLEVNRPLIRAAAEAARAQAGNQPVAVVSLATFGRGIKPELLASFEPYRVSFGHNQSWVATPPVELAAQLLQGQPLPQPGNDAEGFWALGYAFKRHSLQWWNWREEADDGLF